MIPATQRASGAPVAPDDEHRRSWPAEWMHAWDAFWFTPVDPLPLAVIRIATGILLAWSSFVWLLDADAFFGVDGWLAPADVWRMNDQPWQWSWYFVVPTPAVHTALSVVTLVASILLAVGFLTPLAGVLALVGFISSANRAPLNVFGFDDTLGLLLIGVVIGPSSRLLAIDPLARRAWLGTTAPRPADGQRSRPGEIDRRVSVQASVALRLIQVHLCVVYFFSGCGKLLGVSWWEGTALWGAVANGQYRTLDLTGLAWHPLVTNALTLGTLFWETSYAALIWPRLTRPLWLAMAVAVHLGIGLAMGMMEFGLAMITANLAFVPADSFRALAGIRRRPVLTDPRFPRTEAVSS